MQHAYNQIIDINILSPARKTKENEVVFLFISEKINMSTTKVLFYLFNRDND